MKKGTKLGPRKRDNWQMMIDYHTRRGELEKAEEYRFRREFALYNFAFADPYLKKHGEKAGYVYLIQSIKTPNTFKIGYSRNLRSRLNTLNSTYKTEGVRLKKLRHSEDCELIEKLLLTVFKDSLIRGREWFWFGESELELLDKYFSM